MARDIVCCISDRRQSAHTVDAETSRRAAVLGYAAPFFRRPYPREYLRDGAGYVAGNWTQ